MRQGLQTYYLRLILKNATTRVFYPVYTTRGNRGRLRGVQRGPGEVWLRSPGATEVTRAARPGIQATGPLAVRATNSKRRPVNPKSRAYSSAWGDTRVHKGD